MKFAICALLIITSLAASAKTKCDFPYDLAEEDGVESISTKTIKNATELTRKQKSELYTAALHWMSQQDYDSYLSLEHAIRVMKNDSEAGDLYYIVFRFQGVVYTEVEFYPGGNPFGVIFKDGKAIAERHDGDIVCL